MSNRRRHRLESFSFSASFSFLIEIVFLFVHPVEKDIKTSQVDNNNSNNKSYWKLEYN